MDDGQRRTTDLTTGLRRARQVVSVVMTPKLLAGLTASDGTGGTAGPVAAFDWVVDGSVDTAAVAAARDAVEAVLGDRAVLEVGRITQLPTDARARLPLVEAVVRTAFDRLGTTRPVSEVVLGAALAMFVEDVALVRRDAVDAGVLERTPDGSSYRLAG